MNVVYTCDNNFVWIMGISMISLFENNRDMEHLDVFLLGDNISDESKKQLKDIASGYKRECIIIDVPDLKIPLEFTSSRWPKSAFTRMFSGELMPQECKRMLYLDCDIIIRDSIKELDKYNMEEYCIYGVKDCVSKGYKKKIGIAPKDSYINAGVLLMDLDKMRKLNIRQMMAEFITEHSSDVSYADQDILNGMFKGKFGILAPKYDAMTLTCVYTYKQVRQIRHPSYYYDEEEFTRAQQSPAIVHYTTCMTNIRPWYKGSKHPFATDFDKYMQMSPWKNRPKNIAKFDKAEQKIIKIILTLPDFLSYRLIGFIHGFLRPFVLRLKLL